MGSEDIEGNAESWSDGATDEDDNPQEHVKQLQRLPEKHREFFEFLKETDKELLEFNDEDIEGDLGSEMDDEEEEEDEEADALEMGKIGEKDDKPSKKVITSTMVDVWCAAVQSDAKVGAIRSLMKGFRVACHYGDDGGNEASDKFSIMSSSVFNKIMLFVLNEMDGILRRLLKLPASGGKKETIKDLVGTKPWKSYNHLVKSYLGNSLHVLNQMTDAGMISFTLRRLRYSSIFLAAFPSLLRKYIKVALHFWGTGSGPLPVASFLFLRDLCVRLGSDCIDDCFKGIYKSYVLNCQFVNAAKLQHVQFLRNCVVELLGLDLPTAYQHAFAFIRQLAMILREAHNVKTKDPKTKVKELFRKVYEWKFMNCLELWTGAICTYSSEADLRPLAYPLTQIISGVGRLLPTARYIPLRLRCVRMLNRIAASTGTFVPVSMFLLDMLEMKELNRSPTGGVGKAIDLTTTLRVSKAVLKTRAFQEACVYSVIEELADHLSQWSYSIAFFELSFIPTVQLRNFCKATKVERFRKEMKRLVRQIENSLKFTNEKRGVISFLPNEPAVTSFLQDEKDLGASPLTKYVAELRERARQRNESFSESSVVVGEHSSVFGKKIKKSDDEDDADDNDEDDTGDVEGAAAFSSSWLPGSDAKEKRSMEETKMKKKKRRKENQDVLDSDEDVVEDLVLSSDEEEPAEEFLPKESSEAGAKRSRKKKKASRPSRDKKP